jgi:methionyl-tRNA formyltransferase
MPTESRPQRIIFAGSPEFAVPALERLAGSRHQVIAVLTQPDRPAGRGLRARPSPVKACALAHGIEVLQPVSLKRDATAREAIRERRPDLMIVVAYGLLLPADVLAIPRCGCVNIHASLLPRWRGAAPIQAAILAGDAQTGITIMQMDEGLDTGPMLATRAVAIAAGESAGELHDRLAVVGAELLLDVLDAVLAGTARPLAQSPAGVSYAGKITKADARIRWSEPAVAIDRVIRAYNPWPVAETTLDGAQLRCWVGVALPAESATAPPGTIVRTGPANFDVQTGAGLLRLTSVQLAGRQRIDAGQFANGYPLRGKVLGA